MRQIIQTEKAPQAIGSYSQAVRAGNVIYLSGQIPLDPVSMNLVQGDFERHAVQVFENIKMVALAANANLDDVVKLTVYLTDLSNVPTVNDVIAKYFTKPFPARTTIQISALPKNATIEIDAIIFVKQT